MNKQLKRKVLKKSIKSVDIKGRVRYNGIVKKRRTTDFNKMANVGRRTTGNGRPLKCVRCTDIVEYQQKIKA